MSNDKYIRIRAGHQGDSVKRLQRGINARAKHRPWLDKVKVDGIAGKATFAAARKAGLAMGAMTITTKLPYLSVGLQKIIVQPMSRSDLQKSRADKRKKSHKARASHATGKAKFFADVYGESGHVDVKKYKAAGHNILVLKLTEGATFIDDDNIQNIRNAIKAGLTVYLYHFARPSNRPTTPGARLEATHFYTTYIKRIGHEHKVRFILDWEDENYHGSKSSGQAWKKAFADQIKKLSGEQLDVEYSYGDYWQNTSTSVVAKAYWHAAYTSHPESNVPAAAKNKLWAVQYTDGSNGNSPHTAAGVSRPCDMSYLK